MGDYEDAPYIVIERRSGGVTPFLWGVILGAGAALLMAPRSGAETQEEIRERARRIRQAAEDRVNNARDAVTGTVTRTRNRMVDRIDVVRGTVEERVQQAREVLDTGVRVASDARSQLERRVAQARETVDRVAERVRAADEGGHEAAPPAGDVVVTDVVVEEAEGRPDLG